MSPAGGETVLVSGSEGFVGKELLGVLRREGYHTIPFSRSLGQNACEPSAWVPYLERSVDVVIHLAGQSFIPDSWTDPHPFYHVNTLGTQAALDFCRKTGARFVFVSSYVYGKPRYLPIDENHPVCPMNPYTHSKWLGEELCRFYALHFGVSASVIRPFNIFGPGQSDRFLIAQVVRQWVTDHEVVVHDTAPRRDYVYISDFVEACLAVLHLKRPFEIYNVGAGYSVSVGEVLTLMKEITNEDIPWKCLDRIRRDEVPDIVSKSRLVGERLWEPRVSFKEGLATIIGSYKCRKLH